MNMSGSADKKPGVIGPDIGLKAPIHMVYKVSFRLADRDQSSCFADRLRCVLVRVFQPLNVDPNDINSQGNIHSATIEVGISTAVRPLNIFL